MNRCLSFPRRRPKQPQSCTPAIQKGETANLSQATFQKGDAVQVWSNSKKEWLHGVIMEAPTTDCIIDGYSVLAGAVKVSSSAGLKWIMPDTLADTVRKVLPEPISSPCAPSSLPMCQFCSKHVQPGLTKGMKPYSTCCKRCSTTEGKGGHDRNCGGAQTAKTTVPYKHEGLNPKVWLDSLLQSEEELKKHVESIFLQATGGDKLLISSNLRVALESKLLKPIDVKLQVSDVILADYLRKFDKSKRGSLDMNEFQLLCRNALEGRKSLWFPLKLPCKPVTFVRKNPARLEEVYELGKLLGEGSFGSVYSVTHRLSGQERVCKKIQKMKGKVGTALEDILREIESMAMLDHPNVIKVYEYFEDAECVTQIMEPCKGGELQERIDEVFRKKTRPAYNEAFICDIMKQTLRALAFMHEQHFIHRDLKPQNIMLEDRDSSSIKVIDFGLAELFQEDQTATNTFGGTLLYMAPETFDMNVTKKTDVWSAGVILYNLITGDYPFMATWPLPPGKNIDWWQEEVKKNIQQQPYRKHAKLTKTTVSSECLDLLHQMLEKKEVQRPDATKCLLHPWFNKFDESLPPLSVGVTQCLDAFSRQPELKKAIFLLIAHQCTTPALQELRKIFTHFDVSNTGSLSAASFREVLHKSGMPALHVERILHGLDSDSSGTVGWTEFIAGALCISVCQKSQLVAAAFSMFDHDRDGKIVIPDLEAAFAHGAAKAVWKKQLPHECAKIADSCSYTQKQFEKYVGKQMNIAPGDSLCAV